LLVAEVWQSIIYAAYGSVPLRPLFP